MDSFRALSGAVTSEFPGRASRKVQGNNGFLPRFRKTRRRTRSASRRPARPVGKEGLAEHRRGTRQAGGQGRQGARRALHRPHPLAEDASGPASAAAPLRRLHRRADRGFHPARRRPLLRRGRSHPVRPRTVSRPVGRRDRPGEGLRHGVAAQAQFRHGQARGLSQGGARHATRRPLRPACHLLRRHRRRLSRHRGRRARPGGSHRPRHRGRAGAGHAQCRHRDRRRRLRRRGGASPPAMSS